MRKLSLEPAFLILITQEDFEKIYFSRKITMTICTYSERIDQQHGMCNLIKVKFKFLGDKKDQQKVFILKFEKLTQYFL